VTSRLRYAVSLRQRHLLKNEEPSLDDLLAEPIVRLVMARDHVDEAAIRRLAAWVRACCARQRQGWR
jgi:hypothetical protein